jgi:hypothetical protein
MEPKSHAGTLSLNVARSGTKLEKTSLSTGGDRLPACGFVPSAQWLLLEKRASQLLIYELFAYISVNYGETFSASVRTNPVPMS